MSKFIADTLPKQNEINVLNTELARDSVYREFYTPIPKSLWKEIWYEGEISCLFADSNVGKSILAVQIAKEISANDKVIYFDFELSDKQFQLRYTSESKNVYEFNSNFYRSSIDYKQIANYEINEAIMQSIKNITTELGVKVIIIDNLSMICNGSEKGDLAGEFMQKLIKLKFELGLSVLVLAHTPKRLLSSPITQNDLAGSKKLFNLFDTVFALGKSAKQENMRYIKQLKARSSAIKYHEEAVQLCVIEKDYNFLEMRMMEQDSERFHLSASGRGSQDYEEFKERVGEFSIAGYSEREIAEKLGLTRSRVRVLLGK